jgi:glycosyltransferase involved in cell wall biosynthesis
MRILAVTATNDRSEVELYRRMAARGHAVRVLHSPDWQGNPALAAGGVATAVLHVRNRLDLAAAGRIRRQVLTDRPHVLYAPTNRTLSAALMATRGIAFPAVVGYRGTLGHLSRIDPAAWLTYFHPRLAGIVCVASAVESYLRVLRVPARLRRVYKGHDVAWYHAAPRTALHALGIPEDAFSLGFAGSLRPVKGIDVLLRALARIPEAVNVHALLMGTVVDSRLVKLAAKLDVTRRAHMTGYRPDAAALAGACDAFAMPSRAREGLPRAVIEAMAQGVPPLVTAVGGMPELVVDRVSGLVVPPADADALARAIVTLAGDPDTRRRLGAAARSRIAEAFNIANTTDEMLAFFMELAGTQGSEASAR